MILAALAIAGVLLVVFVTAAISVVLAIAAGAGGDLERFYQAHPDPLLERQRLRDRHAALVDEAETNLARARRLQADIEAIPRA